MFGHLQIKSAYSFQSSTVLIQDLIDEAASKHIDALALCDTNNMYGTFAFYKACRQKGIHPVLGVEATLSIEGERYPFILLASDDMGYFHLVRIVSDINLSPEKAVPIESLQAYRDHLFIISASSEGVLQRLLLKEMDLEAERIMRQLFGMFKDRYLVMAQKNGIALEDKMNDRLMAMARYVGVRVICGNDVCYLRKQDALTVDLLQASLHESTLDVNYQPRTSERYLKDENEMRQLFAPEIIEATMEIAKFCRAHIPENVRYLPQFPTPHQASGQDYLRSLCIVGIKKRFQGRKVPENYQQRLFHELRIIHEMGFDDYFLIVWDYVRFAKVNGILVGPGRGSAAGSLVAYALGITNVDPLVYDLLFERFLNPERVSLPDIDIDFQDDRRDEVVNYVIDKYGHEHVAQIVTFTNYGPRVAIRDIGKVMAVPQARLDLIAKMVPTGPKNKKTITEMYQTSASFQNMINESPAMRRMIGPMSIIEHLPRNISKHAAGVVFSNKPLRDVVPLVIAPSGAIMTQYAKDYIEDAGLLKMDFLGLKNLTMIAYILHDIQKNDHQTIDLNRLPLDDRKTYELIAKADTYGVFQLESAGMRNLLRRMKPYCFDDIVAAIALFRPGPMENIPLYLKQRASHQKVDVILEELRDILTPTYGVIIYQEQIMQIAQIVAGFSLGKADILRKGVSKKDAKTIAEMREAFISGAMKNGYSETKAVEIFDLIEKFANYGFNKSHSVAYGLVAYQLAYLKANYPLYFFASILSNEAASATTKLHVIDESKRYGVKILAPSINRSYDRFVVEGTAIRYSLLAIKNVGVAGYVAIIEERQKGPFKDIYDFLMRMENARVTYKMVESLIDAGAFDEFNGNRAFLKGNLPTLIEYAHLRATLGLDEPPVLKNYQENKYTRLENEKNVLGLYLTTHPLRFIKEKLNRPIVDLAHVGSYVGQRIDIVMDLDRVRIIIDKRGNEMAFLEGHDDTAQAECVCFSSQYSRYRHLLERGQTVLLQVRVQMKDSLSLVINYVEELKQNG